MHILCCLGYDALPMYLSIVSSKAIKLSLSLNVFGRTRNHHGPCLSRIGEVEDEPPPCRHEPSPFLLEVIALTNRIKILKIRAFT